MGEKPRVQPVPMLHPETGQGGFFVGPDGMDHVREAIEAARGTKRGVTRYEPHAILFLSGLRRILREHTYTTVDFYVLLAIICTSDYREPSWPYDPAKITKLAGTVESSTHRSIRKWISTGILSRPRRGHLAFHPDTLWRNGAASWDQAKRRQEDPE